MKFQIFSGLGLMAAVLVSATVLTIAFSEREIIKTNYYSRFNSENIKVHYLSDPKIDFLNLEETKTVETEYMIFNSTQDEYVVEAELRFEAQVFSETLTLEANTEKIVKTEIIFTPSESGNQVELTLKEVESGFAISEKQKLISNVLENQELAELAIEPTSGDLQYSDDNKPELNFVAQINYLSEYVPDAKYYEVELVNENGELVQPLLVESLDQTEINGNFTFEIPPADNLLNGTKFYRLKLKLITEIDGERKEFSTLSENTFQISVS